MPSDEVKSPLFRPSRRELLRAAAGVFGALAMTGRASGEDPPTSEPSSRPGLPVTPASSTRPVEPVPWWLGPAYRRSRVVELDSRGVLTGTNVDEVVLSEMLAKGVQALAGARTAEDGWRSVLGSAERIVLKFNQVGAAVLNTTVAMARVLVQALEEAGYERRSVALVEVPTHLTRELGTRLPEDTWGTTIPVGTGREELAGYLCEADAVINVPFLKTHQIAGMSCALKNLSHALIRHPARYHDNGCSPYVAQVVGNKEVSAKLKLNVVNALRAVVRNGPDAGEGDVLNAGRVLLGFDPVAVDEAGHELLLAQRQQSGAAEVFEVRYLEAAAQMGVGRRASHQLERLPITHAS